MIKTIKNILIISIPTLIILFIILEIFFRVGVKANQFPMHYYNLEENVYQFDTTYAREGEWAVGRFASERGTWKINNLGWIDDIDYDLKRDSKKPLITIYGDSQLEALMAGIDGNIAHYLRDSIGQDYDVYRFGKSDAPYSQYLQMNRYANKYWDSDIIIYLFSHNDFYPSVAELESKPVFMQFSYNSEKDTLVETLPKEPAQSFLYNSIIKANYYSAFLRYLFYNLRVTKSLVQTDLFKSIQSGGQKKPVFNNNIDINKVEAKKEIIVKVTDKFVQKVKQENNSSRIIFIIDASRRDIYNNNLPSSTVAWLTNTLSYSATKYGIEFIDLTNRFNSEYKKNGKKFNPDVDGHWSKYGHRLAAEELLKVIKSSYPENDSLLALENRTWWMINN